MLPRSHGVGLDATPRCLRPVIGRHRLREATRYLAHVGLHEAGHARELLGRARMSGEPICPSSNARRIFAMSGATNGRECTPPGNGTMQPPSLAPSGRYEQSMSRGMGVGNRAALP